jgi:hypothetical protein
MKLFRLKSLKANNILVFKKRGYFNPDNFKYAPYKVKSNIVSDIIPKNYGSKTYEIVVSPKKMAYNKDFIEARRELISDLQKQVDDIENKLDDVNIISDNISDTTELLEWAEGRE